MSLQTLEDATVDQPRHVLLVEDQPDQQELVRRAFEESSEPLELTIASSLAEARACVANRTPALVVADINLPDGSGLNLLRDPAESPCPVVIMTSFGDEKVAVQAIKAGAHDYVPKSGESLCDMPRIAARAIREWWLIRQRQQAEQALREVQQHEQIIFDSIQTGLITSDLESRTIIQANRAALEMADRSPADVQGMPLENVLCSDNAATRGGSCPGDLSGSRSGEDAWILTQDNDRIPVVLTSTRVQFKGKPYRVDSFVDITERRRMEKERDMLSAAVDQTADAVIIASAERVIEYANPAFENLTGYATGEICGKHLDDFQQWINSDKPVEPHRGSGDLESLSRTQINGCHKEGEPYNAEVITSPVKDAAGQVINYVSVMRDVTTETTLEKQLRQSQKMEAVGQLAGGVAHDFNNLLMVIMNSAYFVKDVLDENAEEQADVDNIVDAANKAATLTRQLLTFSKRQPMKTEVADLRTIVSGLEKMLRRLLGEDIEIQMDLARESCMAKVDRGQIEQVLVNLAVNSRDAMPQGGALIIQVCRTTVDEAMTSEFFEPADATAGSYVMLAVQDAGEGIPPHVAPHIFEPFYSTKGAERGSGLGLATVYGICKRHKGQISVQSKAGEGTRIALYLLEAGKQDFAESPQVAAGALDSYPKGNAETVLIVEDESAVRRLAARIVRMLGYTVIEAANGEEALQKAREYEGELQLLLSDVLMPGMDGFTLAEKIRELRPGIHTLFASGHPVERYEHMAEEDDKQPLITKPYTTKELAYALRELLDSADEDTNETTL